MPPPDSPPALLGYLQKSVISPWSPSGFYEHLSCSLYISILSQEMMTPDWITGDLLIESWIKGPFYPGVWFTAKKSPKPMFYILVEQQTLTFWRHPFLMTALELDFAYAKHFAHLNIYTQQWPHSILATFQSSPFSLMFNHKKTVQMQTSLESYYGAANQILVKMGEKQCAYQFEKFYHGSKYSWMVWVLIFKFQD